MDELKGWILGGAVGTVFVIVFCGSLVKCSQIKKDALIACIEKTGKPLECEASFRGEP